MSYGLTLATYFLIDLLLYLSVNLQLGLLGLPNMSFIVSLGVGGYAVALFSIGPVPADSLQHYIFGVSWPFPIPLIMALLAGVLVALIIGSVLLRKMRGHYFAIVTLVLTLVTWTIVDGERNFLGGANGLYGIPQPLHSLSNSLTGYALVFLTITAVIAVVCFIFSERFVHSPLGRAAKAIRENEKAAMALGKNPYRVRLIASACGGALAGLSGALLAEYISLWTPEPWSIDEIFPAIGAMIVGGRGNNWGTVLGTLVVGIGIGQGVDFIPGVSSDPGLAFAVQWVFYGLILVGFLWLRPIGLIPERKARWRSPGPRRVPVVAPTTVVAGYLEVRGAADAELEAVQADHTGSDALLFCDHVSASFGGVRAVDDAVLVVERGSVTGLIGPNGAGKSTLINIVSGFIDGYSGRVVFDGVDITRYPANKIAQHGLVRTFQLSSEFARLTVMENMMAAAPHQMGERFWTAVFRRRSWRDQEYELLDRATALLQEFDLVSLADDYAGNLSGGQKRLLELARALMSEPTLLVLDEPMAGVAPGMLDRLVDHLIDINRNRGLTLLIVEHNLEVIERLCPKVAVMAQGRVMAMGNMQQLREDEQVIAAYIS